MPGLNREYTRPTVSSSSKGYATLNSYSQNYYGPNGLAAPKPSRLQSQQVVIVPAFGGIGYQDVAKQQKSSSTGYYNIHSAYATFPNACGQFSSQLCG